MSLKLDLQQQMKDAMRAKDAVRLGVIRFLLSDIRNWEIDHQDATDADILQVIKRQVKQLKDGIAEFESAGRTDLVETESAKLAILESYLPTQLDDAALAATVAQVIAADADRSMGAVMKRAMSAVAGQADGSRVSAEVKKQLA